MILAFLYKFILLYNMLKIKGKDSSCKWNSIVPPEHKKNSQLSSNKCARFSDIT